MKSLNLLALVLAGLAVPASATDLVPRYITRTTEGVVIRRPYFADGAKKYGIKIDSETKLTAFESGALFRFEKFPEATMRLRPSPVPAQTPFAPESFEAYQQAGRALLPPGADAIEFVDSELNPLPINDWHSFRVTFSYRAANQARRQSVIFLNLKPTEQIVIQTAANERDFVEVSARVFNIVRPWHEIAPEDEAPFN
jgi:hypothetical protein